MVGGFLRLIKTTIYILEIVHYSSKGHGGMITATHQTLMGYTLLDLILRTEMELNGLTGMELIIH